METVKKEISIDEFINFLKKDSLCIINNISNIFSIGDIVKITKNSERIEYNSIIPYDEDNSLLIFSIVDILDTKVIIKDDNINKIGLFWKYKIISNIINNINKCNIQNILYGDKQMFIPYFMTKEAADSSSNSAVNYFIEKQSYFLIYNNLINKTYKFKFANIVNFKNDIFNNKILKEIINKKYIYNESLNYNINLSIKGYRGWYRHKVIINYTSQIPINLNIKIIIDKKCEYYKIIFIINNCFEDIVDDNCILSNKPDLINIKNELLELNKNLTENDIEIIYEKDER